MTTATLDRPDRKRLVVFTGDLSYSVRKGIVAIDEAIDSAQWLVVIHQPKKRPSRLLRNQWLNFRRNGWRWIPYQAKEIWTRLCSRAGSPDFTAMPGDRFGVKSLESMPNLRLLRVEDIHAPSTIDVVRQFSPDLGVSLAAPILKPTLFEIPKLGTVNLHKGRVPDYRGMPPAFWEVWNDEAEIGCTVHYVSQGLDTGDIVLSSSLSRAPFATVRGLQLLLDECGVEVMRAAVCRFFDGGVVGVPQASGGRTFRKPTLAQIAELEHRLSREHVGTTGGLSTIAKNFGTGAAAFVLKGPFRRLLSPRITVLLYHRVSDDVRDNLTVGVEQFDRQMALIRRHCRVLTLKEVLGFDKIPTSSKPLVCVTFDDGYLDNYTCAAPILMRHGIPAAFFVSTGIVNSDGRFPHDRRRGNDFIPLMTWDHLRSMHREGFTIGSHSVSHIDCAAEPEEVVWRELTQSREDLSRELGLSRVVFAYPYGGRQHMTRDRLELVKRAGYEGCLSAYGGVNKTGVDRFNVLRRGVHWEYSDAAFLYRCMGV